MDKQRLYEDIMIGLSGIMRKYLTEDIIDGREVCDSRTSAQMIANKFPRVVRQHRWGDVSIIMSEDENKNDIVRLVGERFFYYDDYYIDNPDKKEVRIDDYLFEYEEGYKMWIWFAWNTWAKNRIFASVRRKEFEQNKWITFHKDTFGKWYAVFSTRDDLGGTNRILSIKNQ